MIHSRYQLRWVSTKRKVRARLRILSKGCMEQANAICQTSLGQADWTREAAELTTWEAWDIRRWINSLWYQKSTQRPSQIIIQTKFQETVHQQEGGNSALKWESKLSPTAISREKTVRRSVSQPMSAALIISTVRQRRVSIGHRKARSDNLVNFLKNHRQEVSRKTPRRQSLLSLAKSTLYRLQMFRFHHWMPNKEINQCLHQEADSTSIKTDLSPT